MVLGRGGGSVNGRSVSISYWILWGVRVDALSHAWLDLAPVLTASELVVLGDAIVNRPYRGRQQASDARRDAWFQERGWMVVRLTSEDLHKGFTRLIGIMQRRLGATSPTIS